MRQEQFRRNDGLLGLWLIGLVLATVAASIASADAPAAKIYQCVIDGQRVFSDQRCSVDATQWQLNPSNRMSAQEAAIGYRAAGKNSAIARQRVDAESSSDDAKQAQCEALVQDKNRINSRMRAGYTNKEGERLRARLRKIDSDYYDLRCRDLF